MPLAADSSLCVSAQIYPRSSKENLAALFDAIIFASNESPLPSFTYALVRGVVA